MSAWMKTALVLAAVWLSWHGGKYHAAKEFRPMVEETAAQAISWADEAGDRHQRIAELLQRHRKEKAELLAKTEALQREYLQLELQLYEMQAAEREKGPLPAEFVDGFGQGLYWQQAGAYRGRCNAIRAIARWYVGEGPKRTSQEEMDRIYLKAYDELLKGNYEDAGDATTANTLDLPELPQP